MYSLKTGFMGHSAFYDFSLLLFFIKFVFKINKSLSVGIQLQVCTIIPCNF